jgi:malate/lactate dehydrogenase
MGYKNVEGEYGLVRDDQTGVILNINKTEIQNAREQKRLRKLKEKEEAELRESVSKLENEVGEIKDLLSKLVEKL